VSSNRIVAITVQRRCEDMEYFAGFVAEALQEYASLVKAGERGQEIAEEVICKNGCVVRVAAGESV
jgi:hypothetical protein